MLGRGVLWLVLGGGLLWAIAVGAMLVERRSLIYPLATGFDAAAPDGMPRIRYAQVPSADGTPIGVWVSPPVGPRPVILHFTGNGGFTPGAARTMAPYAMRGYGVVIMNYRGAGGAPGGPSQARIMEDAAAVYAALDTLAPGQRPIVLHGVSLGAAVAVQLAVRAPADAVVLAVPFASLCTVVEHHYPWLPACLIMWDERWESAAAAPAIRAPVLVVGAGRDTVVPEAEALRLNRAMTAPTRYVRLAAAGHADFQRHGSVEAVLDWLDALGLSAAGEQ